MQSCPPPADLCECTDRNNAQEAQRESLQCIRVKYVYKGRLQRYRLGLFATAGGKPELGWAVPVQLSGSLVFHSKLRNILYIAIYFPSKCPAQQPAWSVPLSPLLQGGSARDRGWRGKVGWCGKGGCSMGGTAAHMQGTQVCVQAAASHRDGRGDAEISVQFLQALLPGCQF